MRKMRQRIASRCEGRSAGFTILETAIAMVVMMVAALGAVSIFAYAIGNNASAKDRELAMGVAQQQLEQLRNVAFTDARLTQTSVDGRLADVTSADRFYRVVTTITDSDFVGGQPTLKTIRITVTPLGSRLGTVSLVTRRATTVIGPNR